MRIIRHVFLLAVRRRTVYHSALALTLLRLALAPLLVGIGLARSDPALVAGLLVVGFLSDVFDGVVARAAGVSSPGLRRLDSVADTVFYLAVAFCLWRLFPLEIAAWLPWIVVVLALEALNYAVALVRFRREASYHARSARLWGLLLFAAILVLLVARRATLLPLALAAGMVAQLDALAISLVLRRWQPDVPSVVHAWRLRAACAESAVAADAPVTPR